MRTVITTIGTSLLTNRERPWAGWRSGAPLPPSETVEEWLQTADPIRASAETHTWLRLGVLDAPADTRVLLVHSQTQDGRYCAERLRQYARARRLDADTRQVEHLSYADAATFQRGLRGFVRLLAEEIRAGQRGGTVELAATGGFKAEIAVANLVGALLGAPVHYIYEQFAHLVTIEPLPVGLYPDWLREGSGRALLQRLGAADLVPHKEVASLLKADPRLDMLIETTEVDGGKYVGANLLGEFAAQLLAPPAEEWPPACDILPERKVRLEGTAHHRPAGWQAKVDVLARSPMVRAIRYDAAAGVRAGVRVTPDSHSDLWVTLSDGTHVLGLRVETTAENPTQRQRLLDHLRDRLSL